MVLPIAHAPHSGPVDQPGEGAYLWARSGMARSATTRSNYVAVNGSIIWIVRDYNGNISTIKDISKDVLLNTLHITQALNDEPDTCSFTVRPLPEAGMWAPHTGSEIRIQWASGPPDGVTLFYGFIVTSQYDWRLGDAQPAWTAVQCQDPMWRFDARVVTYRFPAQSATASIQFLVKWFCNNHPTTAHPLDFNTAFVRADMPTVPAFDVINQRPSTVMRTIMQSVGGGFYLDGLTLHAWAGSLTEPEQTNPTTLTVGLKTLHAFRLTEDATNLRRRVAVEGRRTNTLISLPALSDYATAQLIGVPIGDATIFPSPYTAGTDILCRVGTQWMYVRDPISVRANGANPPQTKTYAVFTPGQGVLDLAAMPMTPPPKGWIRVGNQLAIYFAYTGNPQADNWRVYFDPTQPYGVFTAPISTGEIVEWVDAVSYLQPAGISMNGFVAVGSSVDMTLRAHPSDSPVVTLARSRLDTVSSPSQWPQLEGFAQDGRYSYTGAQARADEDVNNFKYAQDIVEWDTDDRNAQPGREQVIDIDSPHTFPGINTTVTILRVELTFQLRTLPPRRSCTGGIVKQSTFLDIVATEAD